MKLRIMVFVIITAGFATAAVYGGISGSEAMLAVGLGGSLLCLLLIPAVAVRAFRRLKIRERKDGLVCFEYSAAEAEEIASAVRPEIRKMSLRISVLLSICFVVIFAPLVMLSFEPGSELPHMLPIAIACVILPWLSVQAAPAIAAYRIRKVPCISVVGRNCILIANRYMGINDRYSLEADAIKFEPARNGGMAELHVRYRYRAGRVPAKIQRWVQIPVPRGREVEATGIQLDYVGR